jgi:agmatine deiminase
MTDLRMPAEWERHRSTWISWPHNRETWPGAFDQIEPAYAQLVRVLASSEPVDINVLDERHEAHVRCCLSSCVGEIRYHHIPTNDAWCRDHGATLVWGDGHLVAVDFEYNAWGGKYPPFGLDARVASRMAERLGIERIAAGLVLEGGAIEVNGDGVLLTTASCVLNPNRNPGITRERAKSRLGKLLGIQNVLWVEGEVQGDDTDGHIDNLARFVGPRDILMPVPTAGKHGVLDGGGRRAAFDKLTDEASALDIRVHALPMPPPIYAQALPGEPAQLPASYANFYIANSVVLVPAYHEESDAKAAQIIGGFFPDRRIELVDCRLIVWGLGAIHCLTQQVPW